jgi:hypothetical protein
VKRDPIMERDHFAAGFGVGAVGVVEERWVEKAGDEDGEPEKKDGEVRRPVAAGCDAHAGPFDETRLETVGLDASNM